MTTTATTPSPQPAHTAWSRWEQHLIERLDEFGMSRLADTTGLDTLSIPSASAVKPGTSDVIWVYSGKGRSQAQARVTAIMECLERSGARWPVRDGWITDTARVLRRTHEVWEADRFTYRPRPSVTSKDPQVWVQARKLSGDGGPVMVPADLCFNGRRPVGLPPSPFLLSTTNGLAASFQLGDALEHGLAEVMERDIVSCAEIRASHLGVRFLAAVAEQFQLSPSALSGYRDNLDVATTIEPASLPDSATALARHYEAAGMELVIKKLPNDFGVPAYGVAAIEHAEMTRHLGCAGYAVRSSNAQALEAALLELAQTRATDLQGAREDRHEPEKQRLDTAPQHHWLASPGCDPQPYADAEITSGVDTLVARCAKAGLPDVAYVEFPGWEGLSVVRVLVPDAETWHATGGWSRFGPRVRALVNGT